MIKRIANSISLILTGAVIATCAMFGIPAQEAVSTLPSTEPAPLPSPPPKVLVVFVGGSGEENPCLSVLWPIISQTEYRSLWFSWDRLNIFHPPPGYKVIGVGFSYGGDALCQASFYTKFDRLILINPVRQGNPFKQGQPLKARCDDIRVYTNECPLPRASTVAGATYNGHSFGRSHSGLVGDVAEGILKNQLDFP